MDKLERITKELRSIKQPNGNNVKVKLKVLSSNEGVIVRISDGLEMKQVDPMYTLDEALSFTLTEKLNVAKNNLTDNFSITRLKSAESDIKNNTKRAEWAKS